MNEYMVYSYLIAVEAVSLCGENVVKYIILLMILAGLVIVGFISDLLSDLFSPRTSSVHFWGSQCVL